MLKKLAPLLALPLFVACVAEMETDDLAATNISDHATTQIDEPVYIPAELFAASQLKNASYGSQHYTIGHVEVLDVAGDPAVGVRVSGRFTGDIDYKFMAETERDGTISVKSPNYYGHLAVGLTIESITYLNPAGDRMRAIIEAEKIVPQRCQHDIPTPTE